jgi:hypothetical protein
MSRYNTKNVVPDIVSYIRVPRAAFPLALLLLCGHALVFIGIEFRGDNYPLGVTATATTRL